MHGDEKLYRNIFFSMNYFAGDIIENILTKWKGDYDRLEKHHGYIQWLENIPVVFKLFF